MIILRNLGGINNYFSQKEFARQDYEGLTEEAANLKRHRRKIAADKFRKMRKTDPSLVPYSIGIAKDAINMETDAYDAYVRKNKNKGKLKTPEEFFDYVNNTEEIENYIKEGKEVAKNRAREVAEQASNKGKSNSTKQGEGIIKKAVGWVKKHPKTSIGTGAGLAILGTGGTLAYKHYKNKNKR